MAAEREAAADRGLRWLLAAALAAFGAVKLLFGHRPEYGLAAPIYFLAAVVELVLAVCLVLGRTVAGAGAAAGFFAVALVHSWLGGQRSCGCLGPLELPAATYRMIAASLGAVAAVLLLRRLQPASGRRGHAG